MLVSVDMCAPYRPWFRKLHLGDRINSLAWPALYSRYPFQKILSIDVSALVQDFLCWRSTTFKLLISRYVFRPQLQVKQSSFQGFNSLSKVPCRFGTVPSSIIWITNGMFIFCISFWMTVQGFFTLGYFFYFVLFIPVCKRK